ncbi:FGGY family carbohydrate kinase [Devosia sp. RR2S18]|uniref:FGGY family carbohydrate kinase n=1 Tax=Devosia rhizosphaerae TaxID=3049774 RepID=UPI002540BFE3|nr:glycerol kinase GlpK [Devosia sp. RR2S18]WIJ26377.1 glycerol kinase GlpK [Devosia sp. RR2S18]
MTASGFVLAVDQGTTNTKALLVNANGEIVDQASVPNMVSYPQSGWAEQSATALMEGVLKAIEDVLSKSGSRQEVAAVAISNQRESIVVWDAETGVPVGPCITWQCRRSAPKCEALHAAGFSHMVEQKTGLTLDPLFPAAKIAWLLDNVEGARARAENGKLRAGTVDTWLLWNLTGGTVHCTDHSNASRTQLFDTAALRWDEELSRLFSVPLSMMPEVRPSNSLFGCVAAGVSALPAGTPIHAMIGDSHAALYGHGVRTTGAVKATYGTGSSLMALTGARVLSSRGISSTIAWSTADGPVYALEGNISVSGQSAAFMAELLGLKDAAQLSDLASSVPDSNGVVFVPALVGLGAPHWRADARGTLTGLSLGTKPAHLARAAIEAIAFQVTDVFAAMEHDSGASLSDLRADGGASRNSVLMQFQADMIGRPVATSAAAEVSALGAAALAFSGFGQFLEAVPFASRFAPQMSDTARAANLLRWQHAIAQTLTGSAKHPTTGGF